MSQLSLLRNPSMIIPALEKNQPLLMVPDAIACKTAPLPIQAAPGQPTNLRDLFEPEHLNDLLKSMGHEEAQSSFSLPVIAQGNSTIRRLRVVLPLDTTVRFPNANIETMVRHHAQRICDGGLTLFLPDVRKYGAPAVIAVTQRTDHIGTTVDYRVINNGITPDAPIFLQSEGGLRRQIGKKMLMSILAERYLQIIERGKTPLIATDGDGSLVDARQFAETITRDFVNSHPGQDGNWLRTVLAVNCPDSFNRPWDSAAALMPLVGQDDQLVHAADEYFRGRFYVAEERTGMKLIHIMADLIKKIRKIPGRIKAGGTEKKKIHTLVISLRDKEDDALTESATEANCGSSMIHVLNKGNVWDPETSTLLLHQGDKIEWPAGGRGEEPPKWANLRQFLKDNPQFEPLVIIENDPMHARGYLNNFGPDVPVLLVAGDAPPSSPTIPEGMLVIDPYQV